MFVKKQKDFSKKAGILMLNFMEKVGIQSQKIEREAGLKGKK